jgi:hypothetical protein
MLPGPRAVRHPLSPAATARPRTRRSAVWPWAALLGLGLGASWGPGLAEGAGSWGAAAVAAPAHDEDAAPEDDDPTGGPEDEHADAGDPLVATGAPGEGLPTIDEATLSGPKLQDGVLPCGLRVIVAQDESLPVAAVVLAIETGTEDDPQSQPGLVHALAYQLLQGNRELRPAGAAALVHDQGGIASLAVGPAQVRYESLVPISALPDVLWVESQRLRAPTVSTELWTSTLRWARRDTSRTWRAPRAAMAAAHGAPGLEHDGRMVTPSLDEMVPRAIGQALAERFRYDQATLVVVSPHRPPELRERIEALFAELPEQPRRVRDRSPRWRTGSAPQALPIAGEKGADLVWPVAPDPASVGQATVWCKALNRQRRHAGEPSRVRVRCHLDVDPRRATLVVQATGADDPIALVQGRIARLEQGEDAPLVERQREVVLREWAQELRGPLPLSRRLAGATLQLDPPAGWRTRPRAALTGMAELAQPWGGRGFGPRLQPGAAIHLVAPEPAP